MEKITPFLWFDHQAEEAAQFYVSIFPNSKIGTTVRYDETGAKVANRPVGSVMTVDFELNGQHFGAVNGGPLFPFTEAISFVIHCKDQEEVDYYWGKFTSEGGQEAPCGWCKDKFGVSWQVVPEDMGKYLGGSDKAGAMRATQAMFTMKKLDVAALKRAYDGE